MVDEIRRKIENVLPNGIYGITAEKFSKGRYNIHVVQQMIEGGIKVIQYREKHGPKSFKEMYDECVEIRKITQDNGVMFIVNDYIELALLVDADGVHVGQDDLPVRDVRKLVGDKVIGLSTHSPEQAQEAIEWGVDYIGVGPLYKTNTKDDVCDPVGLEYLDYVVKNVSIPFVAIGGIKEHNINEVHDHGAKTICLVTEIVGADDIVGKVRDLLGKIG